MLKIGLTGGIGSGKTTVSKIFSMLGIPVFYADEAAKSVMNTDKLLIENIKQSFGSDAYDAESQLNRKFLAEIVFNDAQKLFALNKLVHPAVFRSYEFWLVRQTSPYILKEAAILFESGSYQFCDKIILVTAPEDIRIERVCLRDGISKDEVKARIDKQLSDDVTLKLADFRIINDEKQLLIPQVLKLHHQFLSLL